MTPRPAYPGVEVEYDEWRWRVLAEKRAKAVKIMEALRPLRVEVIVHGSIARGDVDRDSDVDVVVVEPVSPGIVELLLERAGYRVRYREIVQATPNYTPKVYFYLDEAEEQVVSVPLAVLKPREREFYRWGGELGLEGVRAGKRVPGVNKDLVLIIPTERGHVEVELEGNERLAAKLTGVSLETVEERIRVLSRRREHGRTGVFVKRPVPPGKSVEEVVEEVARENPYFRRALGPRRV
ncbi:MAG: nucleotidyltransferase domain-containing protein [Desulfurococcales archaeon]|nr:nucleotidyltransferase domain-containing protein [Desulfurococcales archaeon]